MAMKNEIIKFINNYVGTSGARGVCLGMSGGKDSLITAKLCVEALGRENVYGVIMPNGRMSDIGIAQQECEYLGINYQVLDINGITNAVYDATQKAVGAGNLLDVSVLNTPPRIRMAMLYSIAGSLNYLVANTSNLSEAMIGYTTKWGDNVGDFAPLANLTKTEVCKLGLELNLPESFVMKKPADGLSGMSDEEKIGFSYEELDEYIRYGKKGKNFDKIMKMHKASSHKRGLPQAYKCNKSNAFYEESEYTVAK